MSKELRALLDSINTMKDEVKALYADGKDAHYLNNSQSYTISKKRVNSRSRLQLRAVEGGGFAISIQPVD